PPRSVLDAGRHRTPARTPPHGPLRRLAPPRHCLRTPTVTSIAELIETMEYGPAPESPDIVKAWLDDNGAGFGHYVAGAFTRPGKTFAIINPATGETVARVTQGSAEDVDAAVKAAGAAFPKWAALPGHERARWLYA